jgi:hypothetical protein
MNVLGERRIEMHWYNPKSRGVEDVPAPSTDEEALQMLRGDINSGAFITEYERLRDEGMGIEQALIFVGHEFRLRHLRYQPIG